MRQLFVDPASQKTGWALFVDGDYRAGGAIQSKLDGPSPEERCDRNIDALMSEYVQLFIDHEPDEIYIEKVFGSTSYMVHHFVGALKYVSRQMGIVVKPTVAVQSWQAYCKNELGFEWKTDRKLWKVKGYESEDHYAAYLMGRYSLRGSAG